MAEPFPWMRDAGVLMTLPAMWVDHDPREIGTSLLGVLFGTLQLDAAYVRFDCDGEPLELWRPSAFVVPPQIRAALAERRGAAYRPEGAGQPDETGIAVSIRSVRGDVPSRVVSIPVTVAGESGIVLLSSDRGDFPTAIETHLLCVAVSQAAIAIHTARLLARERIARSAAEEALRRQSETLRLLIEHLGPALEDAAKKVREATTVTSTPRAAPDVRPVRGADQLSTRAAQVGLSQRELEVLGMLARGLSNHEIAGLLWLSDRTVERHITGLYRKIGVARRSEATAFALRHGIA